MLYCGLELELNERNYKIIFAIFPKNFSRLFKQSFESLASSKMQFSLTPLLSLHRYTFILNVETQTLYSNTLIQ